MLACTYHHYAFSKLVYQWYTFSWIRLKRNLFFAVCFQRSWSRKLVPNRPNSNHPNMRDYMEFFMKVFKFFGPIQLLLFPLGWVVVLLGLFFVIDAGNAVQKPLTKKSFHLEGLNCGTCACETHVITTTPCWVCGNLDVLVQYVDFATCFWLMSSMFKRFARNNAGPYSLH